MSIGIIESLIIAGLGGFIAGISVWGVNELTKVINNYRDKKTIYSWLYINTKKFKDTYDAQDELGNKKWRSTIEIASYTNLSPERVRDVSNQHNEIVLKTERDAQEINRHSVKFSDDYGDHWGIRKFVRDK